MLDLSEFSLGERLYAGVSSVVYRARRSRDNAAVVIKLLQSEQPTRAEVAQFEHEFRILSKLDIGGVVRVFGLLQDRHQIGIVMEDVGAETLGSVAARKRLELDEVLRIGARLGQILGDVHHCRVVHGDVNPGNILIHPESRNVWFIDFGISLELSRQQVALGATNVISGTLRYIAPEQTGRMNRTVDQTSDLYSLGATLYELLLGVPPFQSNDPMEIVHCHIAKKPTPPHEVEASIPAVVSQIVMKLLAKDPEERYQSGRGLAADLEACLAHDSGRALVNFELGKQDESERLRIPQKLYGRDQDRHKLLRAFEQASVGAAQWVFVAGYSGIGKTTLVHEVQRPVAEKNGYFITGKFNQQKRNAPYASIVDAFQDLLRQVLTESENRLATWRDRITQYLGSNAAVISEVIPALELLTGELPKAPQLPPTDAQRRFQFAFEQLIRVFADKDHPLVIFLDDLQWADAASFTLLEHLLQNAKLENFLVIGTYRDNEVTEGHPLRALIANVRQGPITVTSIDLAPLDESGVAQIIQDTTRCNETDAATLSKHLTRMTGGNPFFLSQTLRTLYEDGLLSFDPGAHKFRWDIDAIRNHAITADVIELLAGKVRKLSPETQNILRLAASIGNRFDISTLAAVAERSEAETTTSLHEALEEGFVLPLQIPGESRTFYRFFHDRMQQAAYSLIPDSQRSTIHLRLGRMLLAAAAGDVLAERVFEIVPHYELGKDAITSDDERYTAAELALLAGKRALSAAAWEPASRYLSAGIELLPKDAFETRRKLAFDLYSDAAESEYLNSKLDRSESLTTTAMQHAETIAEKVRVLDIRMLFQASRNQLEDVVATGLNALDLLGVHIARTAGPAEIGQALGRTQQVLAGRTAADLWDLPELTDPNKLAALRILSSIVAPVYIVNPPLFVVVVTEFFALCAEFGNSRYAPIAYTMFSTVQMGVLGDLGTASQYADLAQRLLDRHGAWVVRGFVLLTTSIFIFAWKWQYRDCLERLRNGVHSGIEAGDIQHAGYCAINCLSFLLWSGERLEPTAIEGKQTIDLLNRYQLEFHLSYTRVFAQAIDNLRGETADPLRLEGRYFQESTDVATLESAKNLGTLMVYYAVRSMLHVIFRNAKAAAADAATNEAYLAAQQGQTPIAQHAFYQALALLTLCSTLAEDERAAALTKIDGHISQFEKWAEHGVENFKHKLELLRAERARVDGRFTDALSHFERAIQGAAHYRVYHEEALAHELCAEFCSERGWQQTADAHWISAHRAYAYWGAKPKVEWLERRHPALFMGTNRPQRALINVTTSKSQRGSELELSSIMKAARTISGEIVLERLVTKLMRIMVENAGAQRGALLLEQNGRLMLVSEWTLGQSEEPMGQFRSLAENETRIPTAIIQYVARTGENIVLGNATSGGLFTKDPYIVRVKPRSILCAPLVNQGRRIGVAYLENNLVEDVFTTERLEVLELLSAQAALSLQNAEAFATLEQKVRERTVQLSERNQELSNALDRLEAAQEQLVMQEKLAALGTTTAGIAHEIKNPLNFINNFALSAVELTNELAAAVGNHRGNLDADLASEFDELLPMLRQSVQKIDEHGRRANGILGQMLLHARGERSSREMVDFNQLVQRSIPLGIEAIQRRDMNFEVQVDTNFDPNVENLQLAAQDVTRVIVNIITNGWYAVHEKRRSAGASYIPTLKVTTRKTPQGVELRIRDNGTGIPKSAIKRIFEPFFTTKPTGDGTGLGLSIVHDIIVRDHGGTIDVDTKLGEFTEVVITLRK